ncbi:helix-turn-helix domain-containing protein [Streptomyces sp. NBC_01142]|uniref:helix-turn-helix domain-containing protein n=1 Tax=Streptomyces sp. NBC_01142 TaxID=2975865 RepID=UPI00224E548B|nr:helix-turn-helix transcriptional regulator [Streptomyces sp. NBC_01142]MCX4820322.1 helix-turn-helix domain-containing protein [Streptomyces sp. NBC_01142]
MGAPRDTETGAFARRLREIRDGSGRSYGALARRVGVSASTLHRYCAGQTVPLEFAPVERLARFCGCAGDDLVALHRLWVMADAERRIRQEDAARSAATAAGRETAAAGQQESTAEKPGDDSSPEPAPVPEGVLDTASVPAPEPPGAPHEPPAAPPAAPHKPPAASPAAPWWRRRAVHVGAAFVATAVTLAVLMAFVDTPLSAADRRRTAAQEPRTGATGSALPPRGGSRPTPLATPDVTVSGPDDRDPRSTGPGASRHPAPPSERSPAPSEPGRGTLPFTWSTNEHIWQNGCDHAYLLDRDPADVPPPPDEADAEPWARSVGAVHAADTGVRITVQGRSEKAVVLQSIRVRVTARRTPPKRSVYRMNLGCGGSLTPRLFDVDLDTSRPVARPMAGNDAGEPIPAVSFPYKVSAADPESLLVLGRTVACDCDWYLELEWSSGDRSGTVRLDNNGQPFRTSGIKDRPVYDYDTGSRRWIPAERINATYSSSDAASPTAQP